MVSNAIWKKTCTSEFFKDYQNSRVYVFSTDCTGNHTITHTNLNVLGPVYMRPARSQIGIKIVNMSLHAGTKITKFSIKVPHAED